MPEDTRIDWSVDLVNRKAAPARSVGPARPRNVAIADRSSLIIRNPQPATISGPDQVAPPVRGTFLGSDVYLGELRTDSRARYERTLVDRERVLGPDHPHTLSSRNNLAGAYRDAGRLVEAIPLFERTLADHELVLGPDHPHTLSSRNNLAGAYQNAGRLVEAIPLSERTLEDSERVLGPNHPDTLTYRNNLAALQPQTRDKG